ncbi:OLC1v1026147C2 [Oldenlandia corymbosa var. corymbosa]|uniref:OLC1v1026147C2 n=1 Tax=Oldenlandia corymbosa var. corymbosa TaxID=529605 RepID=A0AAV1C6Q1_OLDCO|nr:OLC1v1026147C2 [Oldenlandia corymbosa var. corymbosa]
MDGFVVLDTENSVAIGADLQKATKASFANTSRQKLGDISNLPRQTRISTRDNKPQFMPLPTNDYINQLQKENKALSKLLEERTKLVDVSGAELRRMRITLQKMQLQNHQLAQSNSQLLAELNSGKDRLKALQHELGCQNGLLKAKSFEMQSTKYKAEKESKVGLEDEKLGDAKRRPQSKSLGSSLQVESRNMNDNKRPCKRRQSAKFERTELRADDDFFPVDIRTSECQTSNGAVQENKNGSATMNIPLIDEQRENDIAPQPQVEVNPERPRGRRRSTRLKPAETKTLVDSMEIPEENGSGCLDRNDMEGNGGPSTIEEKESYPVPIPKAQEFRRSSLSRPQRQAVKKVQSYKEIPLKVKMRRQE